MEIRDENKLNCEAIDNLVRAGLVIIPQYDVHLAQLMDSGHNYVAVAHVMQLMQRFVASYSQPADVTPLSNEYFLLCWVLLAFCMMGDTQTAFNVVVLFWSISGSVWKVPTRTQCKPSSTTASKHWLASHTLHLSVLKGEPTSNPTISSRDVSVKDFLSL